MMIVALDFDETYNLCPDVWDEVTEVLRSHGHNVILATYRHRELDYDPLFERLAEKGINLYCTDGKAKRPFLEEQGIAVAVWIDDNPKSIMYDSAWKHDSPELHAWREENKKKVA